MTLDNLSQVIQNENEPSLSSNESVLLELLTILSDKGLILFIRNTVSICCWVIIDKHIFLKEINGTFFAPSHFKEYKPLSLTLDASTRVTVLNWFVCVFVCLLHQ